MRVSILLIIIWNIINLKVFSISAISPISSIGTSSLYLQTGIISAVTSIGDSQSASFWGKHYTVNLVQISTNQATGFDVALGYSSWIISFETSPGYNFYFCQIDNPTLTSFQIAVSFNSNTAFTEAVVSYIVFYKQFGNILIGHYTHIEMSQINSSMTRLFMQIQTDLAKFINPIFIGPSIRYMDTSYVSNPPNLYEILLTCSPRINSTSWYMKIRGSNLDLRSIAFDLMIFQNQQINNQQRTNIIFYEISNITDPTSIAVEVASSVSYPKSSHNFFIGVFGFASIQNNIHYNSFINSNKVYINKDSSLPYLYTIVLSFYQHKCTLPFVYNQIYGQCMQCPDHCQLCNGNSQCSQCATNFTLSTDKLSCDCQYQQVTNICFDFNNSSLDGCKTAIFVNNSIVCRYCPAFENMILSGNSCICKSGYTDTNSSKTCKQICGDRVAYEDQCDDGNTNNNDGCSSTCTLQSSGFICNTAQIPTFCLSTNQISFQIVSILKSEDNQAIITLQSKSKDLPFDLQLQNFISDNSPMSSKNNSFFSLNISTSHNPGKLINIPVQLISVKDNQIKLWIQYNFTIEGLDAKLNIGMQQTRYNITSNVSTISFDMIGDNFPLKFSSYLQLFQSTSYGLLAAGMILLLLLFIGLLAPKYIGLQAIMVLQLIYYSQLLISKFNKWPLGFIIFQTLKYSSGYNDIFQLTTYEPTDDISKKFHKIYISKIPIENFNISFILLALIAIVFCISLLLRIKKEHELIESRDEASLDPKSLKEKQLSFRYWLKINQVSYQCLSQISIWCLLQVSCCIGASIMILNSDITMPSTSILTKISTPMALFTILIILIISMNTYGNLFLSEITLGKIEERPEEQFYKKINFIYLMIVGMTVIFFNNSMLFDVLPISILVTVIHLIYMLILIQINPYKKSLKVHSIGLGICQIAYFIFLMFLNLINLIDDFPDIFVLILGYFILFCCFVLIVFTIIRLYYEYRYGEALQKEIQRRREDEQKKRLEAEQLDFNRKMRQLEEEAQKRMDLKGQFLMNNRYLHENQVRDDQMNDLLDWLSKRKHWTPEMKQEYYFKQYPVKPIDWIQKNNEEQYKKLLLQEEQQKATESAKKMKKMIDPEFQALVKKLKSQYEDNQ